MNKAIILLPGITGSRIMAAERFQFKRYTIKKGTLLWLEPSIGNILDGEFHSRLLALACDSQGRPLYPTTVVNKGKYEYGALNVYFEPIEGLRRIYKKEYTVEFFPYDWRLPCQYNAGLLAERIRKARYEKVILVGHSMGGYVAMHYMLSAGATRRHVTRRDVGAAMVEKCIFAGTPFWGAPKTLFTLETGNFSGFIFANMLLNNALKEICGNFPSIYELLPTKGYFEYKNNYYVNMMMGGIKREISTYGATMELLRNREWVKNKNMIDDTVARQKERDFLGKKIAQDDRTYVVCGTGIPSIRQIDLCYESEGHFKSMCGTTGGSGDGVVPVESASMGGGTKHLYFIKDIDHIQLVASRRISEMINM